MCLVECGCSCRSFGGDSVTTASCGTGADAADGTGAEAEVEDTGAVVAGAGAIERSGSSWSRGAVRPLPADGMLNVRVRPACAARLGGAPRGRSAVRGAAAVGGAAPKFKPAEAEATDDDPSLTCNAPVRAAACRNEKRRDTEPESRDAPAPAATARAPKPPAAFAAVGGAFRMAERGDR